MTFWLTLGICLVLYYLFLKINQKNVSFSRVFLIAGILLISFSFVFEKLPSILRNFIWLVTIIFNTGLILFIIQCFSHTKKTMPSKIDVIFVFGAGLYGKEISLSLKKRLDRAIELADLFPNSTLIVSGGQGKNEDITEALAMSEYLIKMGIEKERILLEDQSTSTYENLYYAMNLYDLKNKKVALVTNQFHVYRAYLIAKKLGIDGYGISGDIYTITLPVFYFREYLAFIKGKIKKEI